MIKQAKKNARKIQRTKWWYSTYVIEWWYVCYFYDAFCCSVLSFSLSVFDAQCTYTHRNGVVVHLWYNGEREHAKAFGLCNTDDSMRTETHPRSFSSIFITFQCVRYIFFHDIFWIWTFLLSIHFFDSINAHSFLSLRLFYLAGFAQNFYIYSLSSNEHRRRWRWRWVQCLCYDRLRNIMYVHCSPFFSYSPNEHVTFVFLFHKLWQFVPSFGSHFFFVAVFIFCLCLVGSRFVITCILPVPFPNINKYILTTDIGTATVYAMWCMVVIGKIF